MRGGMRVQVNVAPGSVEFHEMQNPCQLYAKICEGFHAVKVVKIEGYLVMTMVENIFIEMTRASFVANA